MPRSARIHAPGHVFHVISRCLNGEHHIGDETSRKAYLGLVGMALRRSDATVLAWCIMSNHVHLLVRVGQEPLWRLLKRVNSGYAIWHNRRVRRFGPVFADRYRSILIEEDLYLKELIRYIHLNPVRAGLVASPDATDWSSHRILMGKVAAPPWYDVKPVLSVFGDGVREARSAMARWVAAGIGEPRSPALSGDSWLAVYKDIRSRSELKVSDPILGTEAFVDGILGGGQGPIVITGVRKPGSSPPMPPVSSLIDLVCEELGVDPTEFEERPKTVRARRARQILVRIWVRELGGSQAELARILKVPASIVSRWYSRALECADELHEDQQQVLDAMPRLEDTLRKQRQMGLEPARRKSALRVEVEEDVHQIVTPPKKSSRS